MASENRGMRPLVLDNAFNVKMPVNTNDHDFGHDLPTPLINKHEITDRSIFSDV